MDKKALLEATKEFGRYAVIAVGSLAITIAVDFVAGMNLSPEMKVAITAILTQVGRFLDKYRFVSTKNNPAVETKGLVDF